MEETDEQPPKVREVAFGLTIIIVLIAAVIGVEYLPQPYYAIVLTVFYLGLLAGIAEKLRSCLQIAEDSQLRSKLKLIIFFVLVSVLPFISNLQDWFGNEDRDLLGQAIDWTIYFALWQSLKLVESLLKEASEGPVSVPNSED